jgi:hypothetical protein
VNAQTDPPGEQAKIPVLAQSDVAVPVAPAGGRLPVLAPHRAWQPHNLPEVSNAVQWAIIDGLVEIVSGEGPVVTDRLYELYVRASGGQRVGKNIRHVLDQATTAAIRKGLLCQTGDGQTSHSARTLHLPGTPPVILRRRGDRELEHIPPTEVGAVVRHILNHDTSISDSELKRLLLSTYERVRLTSNASDFLDDCITLARRSPA